MNKKRLISVLPYLYFIVWTIFWLAMDSFSTGKFNFLVFGILILLTAQAIYKNNFVGLSLSALTIIVSLLMFFAVLSEFNDFATLTSSALQLIIIGTLMCFSGLAMAIIIFKHHFRKLVQL